MKTYECARSPKNVVAIKRMHNSVNQVFPFPPEMLDEPLVRLLASGARGILQLSTVRRPKSCENVVPSY